MLNSQHADTLPARGDAECDSFFAWAESETLFMLGWMYAHLHRSPC